MDVLEELTADEPLSRDHVLKRIADWHQRIDDLFDTIVSWCDPNWMAQSGSVSMLEAPMRRLELSPQNLPTLELGSGRELLVAIVPSVLWIVGTNGRLAMTVDGDRYYIVDTAELFEKPRWRVMSALDQMRRDAFDKDKFLSIIRSHTR